MLLAKKNCQIKLTFSQPVLREKTNIFLNCPSGHYCSNDKQQRDKQATCDTSPGFPREPVWLTDWQRRLQDQRDQRGTSPLSFLTFYHKVVFLCPHRDIKPAPSRAPTRQVSNTQVKLFLYLSASKCVHFLGYCS